MSVDTVIKEAIRQRGTPPYWVRLATAHGLQKDRALFGFGGKVMRSSRNIVRISPCSASIRLRTTKQKAQQERNQRPFQQLEHTPRLLRTQRRRQRHRAVGLPLHDHVIALALDGADD